MSALSFGACNIEKMAYNSKKKKKIYAVSENVLHNMHLIAYSENRREFRSNI